MCNAEATKPEAAESKRCCGNCRWWAFPEQVCVNVNSRNLADFTLAAEMCEHWEALKRPP